MRIERVLRVDEGTQTPSLLGIGDNVRADGSLTGSFRTINLDDAPARHTADAERHVNGAVAKFLLNLGDGNYKIFVCLSIRKNKSFCGFCHFLVLVMCFSKKSCLGWQETVADANNRGQQRVV